MVKLEPDLEEPSPPSRRGVIASVWGWFFGKAEVEPKREEDLLSHCDSRAMPVLAMEGTQLNACWGACLLRTWSVRGLVAAAVGVAPVPVLQVDAAPLIAVLPTGGPTVTVGVVVLAGAAGDVGPPLQTTTPIMGRRWYAVMQGLETGVFEGWTVVQPLIIGVAGSAFEKGPLYEDAWCKFHAVEALDRVQLLTVL
ncbi:hypothetical protein BKA93DRAFT_823281 [Sparassis latifolia]